MFGSPVQSCGNRMLKIRECKQLRRRVTQWVKYFGRRPHSPSGEPWLKQKFCYSVILIIIS